MTAITIAQMMSNGLPTTEQYVLMTIGMVIILSLYTIVKNRLKKRGWLNVFDD